MSAEAIARALGGSRAGNGWIARCPAHEDHSPSLSLADGADGRLLARCHASCDWPSILDALRGLGLLEGRGGDRPLPDPAEAARRQAADLAKAENSRRLAMHLWAQSLDPRGTVAERYLNSRALPLGDDIAGRVIRFHPALKPSKEIDPDPPGPTLVAAFTDLRTDAFTGVSRIFLTADGHKRFPKNDPLERPNKAFLGTVAGAAVKLCPDDNVELGLVIAEGVETALAARQLGYRPCWALGSANAISVLPVLGGLEALTVLGESDKTGNNARAAVACARRWSAAGRAVEVIDPIEPGDANDVLLRRLRG